MRTPILNSVQAALGYPDDDEVNDALEALLKSIDNDLAEIPYEASLATEQAAAALDAAIGEAEENEDDPDNPANVRNEDED